VVVEDLLEGVGGLLGGFTRSFRPQARLAGLDEKVIALYAGADSWMSVRDSSGHLFCLSDLDGAPIGREPDHRRRLAGGPQ